MIPQGQMNQFLPLSMRRDPVRYEERARVRITFNKHGAKYTVTSNGLLERKPDGSPVEIEIYKSDLPALLAEVEEAQDAMRAAERAYVLSVKREAAGRLARGVHELSDNFDEWDDDAKLTLQKTIASVEREFYNITGHTPKPFASVEVVEDLPAPDTEQDLQAARIAKALGASQSPDTAALEAQVKALQAQVQELLKQRK